MALLEVNDISVRFGGNLALDDVTITAEAGCVTGLIGPNGAGKTTLFNVATGIYRQDDGKVFLGDRDVSWMPPEKLARLGVVRTFQNVELFSRMTVLENVMDVTLVVELVVLIFVQVAVKAVAN